MPSSPSTPKTSESEKDTFWMNDFFFVLSDQKAKFLKNIF